MIPLFSQHGALCEVLRVMGQGWGVGGLLTSRALPLLVHGHLRDEDTSNPLQYLASVCYDLGGGAADAITVVICCRLRGRRHVGSGPWSGRWPGRAREGPRVV